MLIEINDNGEINESLPETEHRLFNRPSPILNEQPPDEVTKVTSIDIEAEECRFLLCRDDIVACLTHLSLTFDPVVIAVASLIDNKPKYANV